METARSADQRSRHFFSASFVTHRVFPGRKIIFQRHSRSNLLVESKNALRKIRRAEVSQRLRSTGRNLTRLNTNSAVCYDSSANCPAISAHSLFSWQKCTSPFLPRPHVNALRIFRSAESTKLSPGIWTNRSLRVDRTKFRLLQQRNSVSLFGRLENLSVPS